MAERLDIDALANKLADLLDRLPEVLGCVHRVLTDAPDGIRRDILAKVCPLDIQEWTGALDEFTPDEWKDVLHAVKYTPEVSQDFEPTCSGRARKIKALMTVFYDGTLEDDIAYLLADIRHYADSRGLDFGELDRRAYNHYTAETAGERKVRDG